MKYCTVNECSVHLPLHSHWNASPGTAAVQPMRWKAPAPMWVTPAVIVLLQANQFHHTELHLELHFFLIHPSACIQHSLETHNSHNEQHTWLNKEASLPSLHHSLLHFLLPFLEGRSIACWMPWILTLPVYIYKDPLEHVAFMQVPEGKEEIYLFYHHLSIFLFLLLPATVFILF